MPHKRGSEPVWLRSSKCLGGECVEVMILDDGAAVRDAKNPDGGVLRFDRDAWTAFLDDIRAGRLA